MNYNMQGFNGPVVDALPIDDDPAISDPVGIGMPVMEAAIPASNNFNLPQSQSAIVMPSSASQLTDTGPVRESEEPVI